MDSLSEIEDKVEEIFCKKVSDQIEQYGVVKLTEIALKLAEDLEQQRSNCKEIYLCRKIIEFLIGLIGNYTNSCSPMIVNSQLKQENASFKNFNDELRKNSQSALKKKRPPTPPKKPKISRNFHSFQYIPSNKDFSVDLGASNTSLATTISNNSINNHKNKSPAKQSITATRTSSTFSSTSFKNPSSKQTLNNQYANQPKINAKYTETCLDKEQMEENAYEIKDLNLNFASNKVSNKFYSIGVNSKIVNKSPKQNEQIHNSYPRHLHPNPQSIRSNVSNLDKKNKPNTINNNCLTRQNSTISSFNQNILQFGSNDALNKSNKLITRSFDKTDLIDDEKEEDKKNTYNEECYSENEEELSILQKSVEDNNEEVNYENEETEEELEKKDLENEDEAIYDTVAPDELGFVANNTNLNTPINNLKANLVKSLKNSFENRFLNQSMENLDVNSDNYSNADNRCYANYVNIDYFLRSKNDSDDCETQMSQSLSSDHDIDESVQLNKVSSLSNDLLSPSSNQNQINVFNNSNDLSSKNPLGSNLTYDEVFDNKKDENNHLTFSVLSTQYLNDSNGGEFDDEVVKTEGELLSMYKCIIQNIIESENVYIDCLNTLIQYKKAFKSSTESTQPLLRSEQLECIFYQIPQLYNVHSEFLSGVQKLSQSSGDNSIIKIRTNTPTLGDLFKSLASKLDVYSLYLKNYMNALQTLHKCCAQSSQFNEIAKSIKLKSMKGQSTTLEDLLHKPVARVQKNALVLHDLLKYTGQHSEEYKSLQTALQMTQCFLNELNVAATENLFSIQDKTQRRVVKESFIIEFSDSKRKLRHLILFNDILVCAKYKPSSRQKFTFDVKWYASLDDIDLPEESISSPIKESSSEIMSLKSKVSSIRDMIYKAENKPNNKVYVKLKKKQADFEGQLVLLLPQLPFNIIHKNSKTYTFFLSSEFERTQWIESIKTLQQSAANQDQTPVSINELQAWIETCRKNLNPNVGSFLLRSIKDEELLYGDLYLNISKLSNFKRSGEFFIAIETDTYGHFFQKVSTKSVKSNYFNLNDSKNFFKKSSLKSRNLSSNNSTLSSTNSFSDAASNDDLSNYQYSNEGIDLVFDQEFVLDLDGTQIIRFLLFEEIGNDEKPIVRGKVTMEFSRNWLKDKVISKELHLVNSTLCFTLKFICSESSTIRFPAGKVYGMFGVPIAQVAKKEKSAIPYLVVGCVREVERRGMKETGIYRVSGLSSDVQKLKRAFETNPYEAEHLLKEIDIHAVTGLLKMYLRELPEALFTNILYRKFFDAFGILNSEEKSNKLIELFLQLPLVNQNTINFLIEHLTNVNNYENYNKMSLNNLATVFGPTMIYPGNNSITNLNSNSSSVNSDQFTAGTIDVMAQAGILFFFLKRKSDKLINSSTS